MLPFLSVHMVKQKINFFEPVSKNSSSTSISTSWPPLSLQDLLKIFSRSCASLRKEINNNVKAPGREMLWDISKHPFQISLKNISWSWPCGAWHCPATCRFPLTAYPSFYSESPSSIFLGSQNILQNKRTTLRQKSNQSYAFFIPKHWCYKFDRGFSLFWSFWTLVQPF